jgi:hypothetical protein
VNTKKRDRIPEPELVIARRESIAENWAVLRGHYTDVFDREIAVSLTGIDVPNFESRWNQVGVEMLAEKCQYLIEERGFEPWCP